MADTKTEPYGDVQYADIGYRDGIKRYPIDTPDHVRSALAFIGRAKNADEYNAQQLRRIKERIAAAAKKFGITISANAADDKEGAEMALSTEVAARLGVNEDATEADVLAAIGRIEAAGKHEKPEPDDDDEDDDEGKDDDAQDKPGSGRKSDAKGPNPGKGSGKQVSAAGHGEFVQLDPAAYESLVAAAEAGQRAEARQIAEDDAKVVEAAIAAGKIPPARRGHWIAAMGADRDGSTQTLNALAPGLVPVVAMGHALSDESSPQTAELEDIHTRVMASLGINPRKGGN